eukprot:3256854-Rhodomonas_salina.3
MGWAVLQQVKPRGWEDSDTAFAFFLALARHPSLSGPHAVAMTQVLVPFVARKPFLCIALGMCCLVLTSSSQVGEQEGPWSVCRYASCLRACYAMRSTEVAYGGPRSSCDGMRTCKECRCYANTIRKSS